jgi:acyl-CoA reductase-like NAD-dependent aldehyde dehydrogenase
MTVHLPLWRHGAPYRSLDTAPVPDVYGRPATAETSVANAALLRRDARKVDDARAALRAIPTAERIAIAQRAAAIFRSAELPVGDTTMGPDAYVSACSASTGLPHALVRANLEKIAGVLENMPTLVRGLTRGLDTTILDAGVGVQDGLPMSFVPVARSVAAVLPSNSPGVHSLWAPALALGLPVVLKPGSGDPWSPLRLMHALLAAGMPPDALGWYPSDHAGGAELVSLHDRAFVFGGADMVRRYADRPGVSVHGPGFAKVWIGSDAVDRWPEFLDVLVDSVSRNGGRSCINASTIVVPRHADAIAAALAERLAAITPRPLDDPDARLAAFADPSVAERVAATITAGVASGARDVSGGPLVHVVDGLTYLRPTVLRTPPSHALARTEFGFPFVSVVEVPDADAVAWMGPTLVLTAITDDAALRRTAIDAGSVDRLHLGPVSTATIRWDQPHEGNLFEWTWRRRAVG